MPLLEQWRQKFPWISETFAILVGSSLGLGAIANPLTPFTSATISSPIENQWEHPLRGQILRTLQKSPGIHFRELQRQLSAANGTLRHHLRVLINEKSDILNCNKETILIKSENFNFQSENRIHLNKELN